MEAVQIQDHEIPKAGLRRRPRAMSACQCLNTTVLRFASQTWAAAACETCRRHFSSAPAGVVRRAGCSGRGEVVAASAAGFGKPAPLASGRVVCSSHLARASLELGVSANAGPPHPPEAQLEQTEVRGANVYHCTHHDRPSRVTGY
jgi:hypothetical protein